jgi:hypothetical protein
MASSRKHRTRRTASMKHCKGGRSRSSKRSSRTGKKRKTYKWHQKGCQSGGSTLTGSGHAWNANAAAGLEAGSASAHSGSANHYALNTSTLAPPQSSNHLVEKGFLGGSKRSSSSHRRHRHRRHRRFIGEQQGGMANFRPEIPNLHARGMAEAPLAAINSLQGDSTAFKTSNPTIQPIGVPMQTV